MADGLEQAAQAFTSVINADPGKGGKGPSQASGAPDVVFANIGELDADTDAKGGGDDDDLSPEEILYGRQTKKPEADPGNAGKGKKQDREGDDDESDGGDAELSDDEDGEPDNEASDDDDAVEDPESAKFLAQKVEVSIDGEPAEVTVKEALEGYVRTQTFHRRMNQLDDAKKIVRRAAADAVHNYEYSVNVAKQMQAHMDQMVPKEPDWDAEFQKDPAKARELQRYYEKANAFRESLRTQVADAAKKQVELSQTQLAAFAEEEGLKFEQQNSKHWSDPKKKVKDLQSMRKTGLSAGFNEDELSQVYDSRMLTVLLKASKYDRIMASRPQPVKKASAKQVAPGSSGGSARQRSNNNQNSGMNAAMKRLNKTGKIEDAAVVFDQIIRRG